MPHERGRFAGQTHLEVCPRTGTCLGTGPGTVPGSRLEPAAINRDQIVEPYFIAKAAFLAFLLQKPIENWSSIGFYFKTIGFRLVFLLKTNRKLVSIGFLLVV